MTQAFVSFLTGLYLLGDGATGGRYLDQISKVPDLIDSAINDNESGITYDLNGNITNLTRSQAGTNIDILSYAYAVGANYTNQAQSIVDGSGNNAGPLGDRKPALRIDPPLQEVGDPRVRVRVARRADVRPDAASRAVPADHVKELMRRKMRQFVEADQRNLCTLPVVNRGFELQVRELDLAAARPTPLAHPQMRGAAEPGVEIQALIPQRSGIGDLGHGAPEEHGGEIGNPADMAQRFQDQSGGLSATRRAAVDAHVGRAPQKLGLAARLRGDCLREWNAIFHLPSAQTVCFAA